MRERFWTIPNILSLYRIGVAPIIAVLLVCNRMHIYAILMLISLLSDIADGYIARRFNMMTAMGAQLDSIADTLTYILGFWGVLHFKWQIVSRPNIAGVFFVFLTCYLLLMLTGLLRFGRPPSLHTYSFKLTAYLQGACLCTIFLLGFNIWFYYIATVSGILSCCEEIVILLLLESNRSNIKGLYWLLKERTRSISTSEP